jgi:hypothetical protein
MGVYRRFSDTAHQGASAADSHVACLTTLAATPFHTSFQSVHASLQNFQCAEVAHGSWRSASR